MVWLFFIWSCIVSFSGRLCPFLMVDIASKTCSLKICKLIESTSLVIKVRLSPCKKHGFIYLDENPFKMKSNALHFILKVLFVLKIFKFLSWVFWLSRNTVFEFWVLCIGFSENGFNFVSQKSVKKSENTIFKRSEELFLTSK